MTAEQKAWVQLHIAVLLFGFTAILGKLIQLSAFTLVWWRVCITTLSLLLLIKGGSRLRQIPRASRLRFMGIGMLVAFHWLAFYGAIKLANASVALVGFATTSFFTALVEPALLRQKVRWYEIILGLLIIPGILLVVNSIKIEMIPGLLVGLLSALLAALFATFNKKYIGHADEQSITFLELGSAWLYLTILIPFVVYFSDAPLQWWPKPIDWLYLMALALVCTTLGYILSLRALHHISAFASTLTINLEPLYGVVMAWLFLKENKELSLSFYAGMAIITLAVFSYPVMRRKWQWK